MPDSTPIDQLLLDLDVDWRAWPIVGPPQNFSRFETGLNHQTLLLESSGVKYVLKLFNSPSPIAVSAQRWAAKLDLSPNVLYAPNDGRYLLMDFVDGVDIDPLAADLKTLSAIASVTKAMHHEGIDQTGIACGYFNYLAYCDHYLEHCDSKVRDLHHSLLPALGVFTQDKTPLVFCHNDLVLSNYLLRDGKVVLLDWEFAQINNPWFDLASIICYWQLDTLQSKKYLAAYKPGLEEKSEQPIFFSAQCAVVWLDILWHLDKFGLDYYPKLSEKLGHLKTLSSALDVHIEI